MIVLHPNTEQYNALNGYENLPAILIFVKDGSNRWIVGLEVLESDYFKDIHDQLNELERIEYTPFPETE
jgi:hypothetical protein